MMERYTNITSFAGPPPGTGAEGVRDERVPQYDDLFPMHHSDGCRVEWIFDENQFSGPSYRVALTGPEQYTFSDDIVFPNSMELNFPTSSSELFPLHTTGLPSLSPDLSLFSMSPLLRGLSGGDTSPTTLGDNSLAQFFQEANLDLSPNVLNPSFLQGSPPLSPLTFATDPHDSPVYHPLLLLQDDGDFPDLPTSSGLRVAVGGSVDRVHYPHRRPASVLTSSSESVSGSSHSNHSPFSPNSSRLLYPSSPNTDYGSSVSLTVPTNSRLHGSVESIVNNSERAHYSYSDSTGHASQMHETRDPTSPAEYASGWLVNSGYEQQNLSVPLSRSEVKSIDSGETVAPSGKPIASKASREASDKRRKKDARYQCPKCIQRLTSRDNLMSHLDAHNNIKRFPCQYCPGRCFRTRAVLVRHQKSSRCGKRSQSMMLNKL